MGESLEDTPTFIATPKGDELVIMTRRHYDQIVAVPSRSTRTDPTTAIDDTEDEEWARRRRDEWMTAGRPTVPLAVVRRVRAGDSYLKAFRTLSGLTQNALAEKVGIRQGQLSEFESGTKTPNDETRAALAMALGIHPVLLTDRPSMPA